MSKKKILITVKTYPSISTKYDELVCTAGFDEEGNWIRIYPIPFRKLSSDKRYSKYNWIEMDLTKNTNDFRPESYRPINIDAEDVISFHGGINTKNYWEERKNIVLQNVYDDIELLINEAKDQLKSLTIFKPTKIIDFIYEPTDREWDKKRLAALRQYNVFEEKKFEVVRKLPFKFKYIFSDINGKECRLMNEDWELGALFWKGLQKNNGDEKAACEYVRKKYWNDFVLTKDLYFFLGTTKLFHLIAPNPFIIIGTFHPPIDHRKQLRLEFDI